MKVPNNISPDRTKAIEEIKMKFLNAYETICWQYECYVDIGWSEDIEEAEPYLEVTFGHQHFGEHLNDLERTKAYDMEKN